jgi:hypothetical protein
MKDSADQSTIDLFPEKRRGRPVTGSAKTAKQRMREYRQRKQAEQEQEAQSSVNDIVLRIDQFETMTATINQLTRERDEALLLLKYERENRSL